MRTVQHGAHRHQAKRKPDTKDRMLRDSLCYMKCPEQVNPSDRQESGACLGLGMERDHKQVHRIFPR